MDDFESDITTAWEGVRNHEAKNLMKEMKVGDKVRAILFPSGGFLNPFWKQKRFSSITPTVKLPVNFGSVEFIDVYVQLDQYL